MRVEYSIESIKKRVGPSRQRGNYPGDSITGVATLSEAREGDLSFLHLDKYRDQVGLSQASVILVPEDFELEPQENQLFLHTAQPSIALARICEEIARQQYPRKPVGIHISTTISESAVINESAYVGPGCIIEDDVQVAAGSSIEAGCFLGRGVKVGEDCWLKPRVTLMEDTCIGNRVTIHSGVVLGADGYAYEFVDGRHEKIPQLGNVEIGDDVEIGANTTIDRGRLGPTTVGSGTKIDNQVQIGHNVRIGQHCILCAQVGIAGSAIIEDFAVFGGRAGASGHLTIGKGAQVAGCSVAFSDLEPGTKYGGVPAVALNVYQRLTVLTRKLPDLFSRMKAIEASLGLKQ